LCLKLNGIREIAIEGKQAVGRQRARTLKTESETESMHHPWAQSLQSEAMIFTSSAQQAPDV